MKAREIEDAWRHVAEKPYPIRVERFEFANVTGFRNGHLEFKSGVNVVCGGNGVGKSTLLQAFAELMKKCGATCGDNSSFSHKTKGATLKAKLQIHGTHAQVQCVDGNATQTLAADVGPRIAVTSIDVAHEVVRLRQRLLSTDNLEEALEQVESALFDRRQLERAAYFMGRTYSAATVAELDLGADFEEVPFFSVTVGAYSYDSRNMGLGEFTIMYLLWRLDRLPATSIALIEEPEVFMSPLSQLRFANILAEVSARKKIWCIASTHSPALVTQVADQIAPSVGLLQHSNVGGEVVDGPRLPALLRSLGMVPNKRFFVFGEDCSSVRLIRFLLANETIDTIDEVQFVTCGSESEVTTLAERWEQCRGFSLGAVFVLDGDMRSKTPAWRSPTRLFLPGNEEPEVVVKQTIIQQAADIAMRIGRRQQDIEHVMAQIDGVNIHDWAPKLAERLGTSLEALCSVAFAAWAGNAANGALASGFVSELNSALAKSEERLEAAP